MNTLILAYHRINDWSEDTLVVHPTVFRQQLDWLAGRYRVVPFQETIDARLGVLKPGSPLASITFDDGYHDNYLFAFPILQEFGFTATFFLTAGFIGTERLLPRDRKNGRPEKDRLLNWAEAEEMAKAGFTFGSHSLTHLDLTTCGLQEAQKEVEESKKILEGKLGTPTVSFCYPRGAYSPEVKRMVEKCGYRSAVVTPTFRRTFLSKKFRQPADRYALKRIGVYHHTSLLQFRLKTSLNL